VTQPLRDPQAIQVLRKARLCSVAVQTTHGPHVTPEAFAVAAGRLWIVTSCKSVKVRSLRRNNAVGVLVRSDAQSLSLLGRAEVLSPWSLPESMRLLALGPAVLEATARYAIGNIASMLGYALDLCRLPAGALPLDRVLVAITTASGLLADGDEVARAWGRIRPNDETAQTWAGPQDLKPIGDRLPADVAQLLDEDRECVVAFSSHRGPVALPGSWFSDRRHAEVPWTVAKAAGLPEVGEMCTSLDDSNSLRPTQLRGVMLRGPGRALRHKTAAAIDQRVRRATWWNGFETGTVKASAVEVLRGGRAV
jgi:nitroimidazol reductase NimA-like FMN-containing flavoprotein (pyridoxamine 5'-phosphate oxidase superfamily)